MTKARKKVRAVSKDVTYRVLDRLDDVHTRVTQRSWFTPGASAAESWLRSLDVLAATASDEAGYPIVSLTVQDGVVLSGPADPENWNSIPVRVARAKRIAQAAGLAARFDLTPAHYALLDNILNRYVAEFCSYPYQSLRTMNLRPGDVFIDIGAFRGYVSVKTSIKVGTGGHVYAFEPVEENYRLLELHRVANRLQHLTTFRAAVTAESDGNTINLFRTKNQGNAVIRDHLRGDAQIVQVPRLGARDLVELVRSEHPDARRIVCSVTTNGTEMDLAEALMEAFENEGPTMHSEIIIPVIFTRQKAQEFAKTIAHRGWRSDLHYPWMRLWSSPEGSA